ncbi:MAG: glycosyltransferase family 39 protein [Vicinamibacteria bacterium]|nr:glycosyltransferase family 39 protein [Vicinamibacteria bacterium]
MTTGLIRAIAVTVSVRVFLVGAVYSVVGSPGAFLTADSAVYLDLARSLTGGTYEAGGVPHIRRPPGYPALLAPGAALGHPIVSALLLQIALGALTTLLVYRVAARFFDERGASRAAVLCAVEPTAPTKAPATTPSLLTARWSTSRVAETPTPRGWSDQPRRENRHAAAARAELRERHDLTRRQERDRGDRGRHEGSLDVRLRPQLTDPDRLERRQQPGARLDRRRRARDLPGDPQGVSQFLLAGGRRVR